MSDPLEPTQTLPPTKDVVSRESSVARLTATTPDADATTLPFTPMHVSPPVAQPTGRYVLGAEIARGGMGVVCRATDTVLVREVAVKLLHEKFAGALEATRRFAAEARITARLQHPAIPPVHDLGLLPDGRPFLAMKLIRGRTLAEELAARPDASADRGRLVQAFEQVCQAMAYAHAHLVIHRDLKPLNVMLGAFGEVQVMDWGLAKELGAIDPQAADPETGGTGVFEHVQSTWLVNGESEPTRAGAIIGTPGYMPPEQARGEIDQVDRRADVFSLGAILCELLTGSPPYGRDRSAAASEWAMKDVLAAAFQRLDDCGADAELLLLCKRCLSVDPADRPADAGTVATALAEYQAAAEERARQAVVERARTEEQRKRWRVQLALAGAVLLLTFAGAFGVLVGSLWQTAEANREDAETQRDAAKVAQGQAFEAKGVAERAQAAEAEARRQVERERNKLASFEYGGTMRMAYEEWHKGNFPAMRFLLDNAPAKLRGWEWHYLNRLSDSSLFTLQGHRGAVTAASFSPDGARIITASGDFGEFGKSGEVKVWHAQTGAEVLALQGHSDVVWAAEFSRDGERIVTGSWDKTARVWDAKTGRQLANFRGHEFGVADAAFILDGSQVVTVGRQGEVKAWDAASGVETLSLSPHHMGVAGVSVSEDGARLVTFGAGDKLAKVLNAQTGEELFVLKGHNGSVASAAFSADGTRIVTASNDGTAIIWDARTGLESLTLKGHTAAVRAACFSPDGARVLTASEDRTANLWDAASGKLLRTWVGHWLGLHAAAFSPDGTRALTGSGDHTAKVWDVSGEVESLTLRGHAMSVTAIEFDPAANQVVTGSLDGAVKLWDARSGAELLTFATGQKNGVRTVAFAAEGRIITVGEDGTELAWDVQSGEKRNPLPKQSSPLRGETSLPDRAPASAPSGDNTATVGDAQAFKQLLIRQGHTDSVYSVAFSADGARAVTTDSDRNVKVWDAITGVELFTLRGLNFAVNMACFSPDGTRVVTGGMDGNVTMWDADSGAQLLSLKGHSGIIEAVAFSTDGSRIATASRDRTAKIWDSRPFRESHQSVSTRLDR